jgi:hypothetical protein
MTMSRFTSGGDSISCLGLVFPGRGDDKGCGAANCTAQGRWQQLLLLLLLLLHFVTSGMPFIWQ